MRYLFSFYIVALVLGLAASAEAQWPVEQAREERDAGVSGAFQLGFDGDQHRLLGFGVQAHVPLTSHVGLDLGFARRWRGIEDGRLLENAATFGPRLEVNPRSRFRVYVPLAIGLTVRRTDDDVQNTFEREYLLSAEGGLGLRIHLAGPLYAMGDIRAVARRSLSRDHAELGGLVNLGASFLF